MIQNTLKISTKKILLFFFNEEVGKLFPLVVRSVSELHKGTSSSLIGYKYRKSCKNLKLRVGTKNEISLVSLRLKKVIRVIEAVIVIV